MWLTASNALGQVSAQSVALTTPWTVVSNAFVRLILPPYQMEPALTVRYLTALNVQSKTTAVYVLMATQYLSALAYAPRHLMWVYSTVIASVAMLQIATVVIKLTSAQFCNCRPQALWRRSAQEQDKAAIAAIIRLSSLLYWSWLLYWWYCLRF